MRISVIIPTYNRAHVLPAVIESLLGQDFPAHAFEILIVDDGSTDGSFQYLQTLGPPIRVFSQIHGGASRARNLAARNATGTILAFTDDDCRPEKNWLRAIALAMEKHQSRVGLLGHTYSEHPASTFVHSVFKDSEPVVTCNFAVAREAFRSVGGFDDHFVIYFEDEDLGLRLKKAGYPIVYEPGMRVLHPSKYQSFRGFLRMRSSFQYFCYMSQKHPDADHWKRHREVVNQIIKRFALFGIPMLGGWIWSPLFLLLPAVLIGHFLIDGIRARKYREQLAKMGYRLSRGDFLAFTFLNWAVPFIDAWRIVKGYLMDWRRTGPWTAAAQSS
ncbi:MAG TPA: glycosyltransferase family 2 protein [Acidobacteriota bacterium]